MRDERVGALHGLLGEGARLVRAPGRVNLIGGHVDYHEGWVVAMAIDRDGAMLDDFRFAVASGRVHVLNVPSPAATASIAIGRHIAALLDGQV